MGFAAFIPLIASALSSGGGSDKRKSKSRDDIERSSLREQRDLSSFIQQGLADTGVIDDRTDQLARGGQLEETIAADLERFGDRRRASQSDPIAQALRGGVAPTPGQRSGGRQLLASGAEEDARARSGRKRESRLATKAGEVKRQDIASIFGGDLASRAGIANAVTGQISEEAPKPTGINKLFSSANKIFDKIF